MTTQHSKTGYYIFGLLLTAISIVLVGSNNVFGQQVSTTQAQRHAAILKHLSGKAMYDKHTQVSYIFDPIPTDLETIGVASRNNIFFAEPGKLVVGGGKDVYLKLKNLGFNPVQVANGVYEINVGGDIVSKKLQLLSTLGTKQIVYKYTAYTSACTSLNDPEVRPLGTRQNRLQDGGWIANGIPNPITHDIDSVQSRKGMHVTSTAVNPNIVVNILDGGFDDTNPEFQGRVIWKWNFPANSANTTITGHGSSVASMSVAKINNNFGGAGMYGDGPIRMMQTSSDGITINVIHLYNALDSLIQFCQKYPNQRQITNMSFGSGNDPVFYAKLQLLFNMNGQKQNFFQAATGNSGSALARPAKRPECTARGATTSQSTKTIWSGSNIGPEMIDHGYVNDGQSVWALQANGSYTNVTGTSFSTPLGTGAVANIVAQDTSRTNTQVRNLLDLGARDLGTAGPDEIYGKGWAQTGASLKIGAVIHMPNSFDATLTPSYNFIPKYYNGLQTTNEKVYVNGTSTPITPTINANGQAEFLLSFTTAAGFVNGVNSIRYEFTTADGCVTTIYTRPFNITNLTIPTSIIDPQNPAMFIRITPNPASQLLNITGLSSSKIYQYVLSDYTGRSLLKGNISQSNQQQININTIPAGVYLLRLYSVQQKRLLGTEKIIIVH